MPSTVLLGVSCVHVQCTHPMQKYAFVTSSAYIKIGKSQQCHMLISKSLVFFCFFFFFVNKLPSKAWIKFKRNISVCCNILQKKNWNFSGVAWCAIFCFHFILYHKKNKKKNICEFNIDDAHHTWRQKNIYIGFHYTAWYKRFSNFYFYTFARITLYTCAMLRCAPKNKAFYKILFKASTKNIAK